MIFKSVLAGALGALLLASAATAQTPAPSLAAPDAAALERARHLMQTMHVDETTDRILAAMETTMQASVAAELAQHGSSVQQQRFKDLNDAIFEEVRALMPRLNDEMASVYATDFSEQELADMDAFYSSPTGQKVLATVPQIVKQISPIIVTEMPEVMSRAFDRFCNKSACTPQERAALSKSLDTLRARTGQVGG